MSFSVGDTVKRNPKEADRKGNGLTPPAKGSTRWTEYFNELGKIIEVETKYGSIVAVRVKWNRGARFRYDFPENVLTSVTSESWLEDELFEI